MFVYLIHWFQFGNLMLKIYSSLSTVRPKWFWKWLIKFFVEVIGSYLGKPAFARRFSKGLCRRYILSLINHNKMLSYFENTYSWKIKIGLQIKYFFWNTSLLPTKFWILTCRGLKLMCWSNSEQNGKKATESALIKLEIGFKFTGSSLTNSTNF